MHAYLNLLQTVLTQGVARPDRTGTGTLSLFGFQLRCDLAAGFPLLTTKKIHLKSIIHELLWFLRGDTNVNYLQEHGVHIWDAWADEQGDLGRVYGAQWRSWQTGDGKSVDQIKDLLKNLQQDPYSRRHLVVAYNPGEIESMALPPCHAFFQLYVAGGKLSCQLYQRSADVFLGVPFNIASYALLTMMLAQVLDLQLGEFIHTFGDVHLYQNHIEQARLQLSRAPFPLPKMHLNPEIRDLFAFRYEDFTLQDYQAHPHIKAAVAI